MKLLVVEDHQDLRALLQAHLERMGFAVDVAATGRQALDALAVTDYEALILDLGLPDMDGMQVLARCDDRRRRTPASSSRHATRWKAVWPGSIAAPMTMCSSPLTSPSCKRAYAPCCAVPRAAASLG